MSDRLDLAIQGIEDDLENYEGGECDEYDDGYKAALRDTIKNLKMLGRAMPR
jgi:hypothetical protein